MRSGRALFPTFRLAGAKQSRRRWRQRQQVSNGAFYKNTRAAFRKLDRPPRTARNMPELSGKDRYGKVKVDGNQPRKRTQNRHRRARSAETTETSQAMNEWLSERANRLAAVAKLERDALELSGAEIDELLELAAVAAHESGDRRNAPLLCYLVGLAASSGRSLAELAREAR
jgi:hypothetical protein